MFGTARLSNVDDTGGLNPTLVQFRNRKRGIFAFKHTGGTVLEEARWFFELVTHDVDARDIRNRGIVPGSELGNRMETAKTSVLEFLDRCKREIVEDGATRCEGFVQSNGLEVSCAPRERKAN